MSLISTTRLLAGVADVPIVSIGLGGIWSLRRLCVIDNLKHPQNSILSEEQNVKSLPVSLDGDMLFCICAKAMRLDPKINCAATTLTFANYLNMFRLRL